MSELHIAWLQDLNPFTHDSGAEQSDRAAIVEGIRRGHEIQIVLPETLRITGIKNFDLAVISNATCFNQEEIARTAIAIPYVMYLHDYWPLCSYRLFYPMKEKCKTCKNTKGFAEQLLKRSVLNIFLSPLHLEAWKYALPFVEDKSHYFHVSPVDTELFTLNSEVNRLKNTVLGVNSLIPFKGMKNILAYVEEHKELSFTFVGAKDDSIELPKNANFFGYVSPKTLPEFYWQAEYFIHLPNCIAPCERTVIEAKLSGCKLILNENVGVASYKEFESLNYSDFKVWIKDSTARFWNKIEKLI